MRSADRAAGVVAGVVGVLVGVWVLLPLMADVPGWFARQARTSTIARFVDERFPEPPDTVDTLRRLVGEDQFPRVFAALEGAPDVGPPPTSTNIPQPVVDAVVPSTVKVEGVACDRIQEGSGFVVGDGLVVTNAHVVAGEDETIVQRSDGSEVRGQRGRLRSEPRPRGARRSRPRSAGARAATRSTRAGWGRRSATRRADRCAPRRSRSGR